MCISSLYLLDTVCGMLELDFTPGMWDVLMSTTLPDLSFFKFLLALRKGNRFGVHDLVWEKEGFPPRIYI
jgi:hypothetical protein